MSENIFFFPYSMGSKSLLELRKHLPIRVIRTENSQFVPSRNKLVVNWGSSANPLVEIQKTSPTLNKRVAIQLCANKARFFDQVRGNARIPEFTTNPEEANEWIKNGPVVGREKLNGHSGEGIIFSDELSERDFLSRGKLFVKYVPKRDEFRVHVFQGRVIDVQQKKARKTDENGIEVEREHLNFRVRSYKNGFIFARNEITVPPDVLTQAVNAFGSIPNLDFGAVDVIWNNKRGEAYVLEINTAPGLEGTTAENYAREFSRINKEI